MRQWYHNTIELMTSCRQGFVGSHLTHSVFSPHFLFSTILTRVTTWGCDSTQIIIFKIYHLNHTQKKGLDASMSLLSVWVRNILKDSIRKFQRVGFWMSDMRHKKYKFQNEKNNPSALIWNFNNSNLRHTLDAGTWHKIFPLWIQNMNFTSFYVRTSFCLYDGVKM